MISLESELLFFFSALGVFNTGVLGAYLLFVKNTKIQNAKALGALLLLVTVRVGVSCFYFHSQSFPPAWIQVGLTSNVMAGSVLLALLRGFDREVNLLKERQFVFLSGTLLLLGFCILLASIVMFGILVYAMSFMPFLAATWSLAFLSC